MEGSAGRSDRWDVVGVGANSLDYVYTLPTAPQAGGSASKLRITSHSRSCGGQTATTLATCSRLGLRTAYVGAFGNDDNGDRMRHELAHHGIDLTRAVVRDAPNAYAVILVDATTGERIVLWDRDARLCLNEGAITPGVIRAARIVHVDDVDPVAALVTARIARAHHLPVTSDIERADDRADELVGIVTHPIFAEHCVTELTGVSDIEQALRRIRTRHAGLLTVTLGALGCMALDGDHLLVVPGIPVHAIDTTGAGDVFRGAFVYGVLQGWPVLALLRFANAAAAASCQRPGAMSGVPDLPAITALLDGGGGG